MSEEEGFYIGWKEKMSEDNRSFLKKRLIPILIGIPILVFLLVYFQKPVNNHSFEIGKVSDVKGVYYNDPYPVLLADPGQLKEGLSPEILLVGYGKAGAKGTMTNVQEENGNLQGKKVTLRGTLIYGDGKVVMELTKKNKSLVEVLPDNNASALVFGNKVAMALKGEILDPKCYFGVMKPGEGKIHKSCAIRCISGGIPPVFRQVTGDPAKPYKYYLMVSRDEQIINEEVLAYVGEQISIRGIVQEGKGWSLLYSNTSDYSYLE